MNLISSIFSTLIELIFWVIAYFKSNSVFPGPSSIITQQFVDFLHLNKITVRSLSSYGLNNFVLHSGGLPLNIYFMSIYNKKIQFVAGVVFSIALINLFKLVPYLVIAINKG